MGQRVAKELLMALGGKATIQQIRALAKERYSDSISEGMARDLRNLRKWHEVKFNLADKTWEIIQSKEVN